MRVKVRLSYLRDIGWSLWDPIGILPEDKNWKDEPFADEYDSYLLQVAGQLRRGEDRKKVVDYLVHIETVHMGLGAASGTRARAEEVVTAIENEPRIWTDASGKTAQ
jgi:hypothetical protein